MAAKDKTTDTTAAETEQGPTADQPEPNPHPDTDTSQLAKDLAAEMAREPKTGTPSPEQIKAQREREDNANRPQLPDVVNTEGELRSEGDVPMELSDEDRRALIAPPKTSGYVTLPDHYRDEAENDEADLHYHRDEDGNRTKPHWVQVDQVHTYDDGTVPRVTLRCECGRYYGIDWTGEAVEEIVQVSRV